MEAHLLERVSLDLENSSCPLSRFRALTSAAALLANPNSCDTTRRTVVCALSRLFCLGNVDPAFLRYVVKLLGDVAALHGTLAPSIIELLLPLLDGSKSISVIALSALSSVDGFVLDESQFLSFASSSLVSVRSLIAKLIILSLNKDKPSVLVMKQHSLIPVLLGFTEDIYPLIRAKALDGLASICRQTSYGVSFQTVKCLYDCAELLLSSDEVLIRLSAVRLISACAQFLERNKDDTRSTNLIDAIFVQLCVMARDMNMIVRVEAFSGLENVHGVSENMLLQSLSKKILGTKSIHSTLTERNMRNFKFPFSSSAGAFLHGIEDEFHEVRFAACKSLGSLTVFSAKFASAAMDLLMDVLNDDSIAVRLQSLDVLYQMASHDRLVIQEKHLHMVLGLLNDVNDITRFATRKFLRTLKIPKLDLFKATISSLLTNLEAHPEEEEDVLFILLCIGMRNAKFSSKLAKEFTSVIQQSVHGELFLDAPRVVGQLMLIVSSTFSNKQKITEIPPILFSYVVPLAERISRSLGGFISQFFLSDYFCHLSGIHSSFGLPIPEESKLAGTFDEAFAKSFKQRDQLSSQWLLLHEDKLRFDFNKHGLSLCLGSACYKLFHQEEQVDVFKQSIQLILRKVQETWSHIHSHYFFVALKILRCCEEELYNISLDVNEAGAEFVAFAMEYVLAIKLVAEIWQRVHAKCFQISGLGSLYFMVGKLEKYLERMEYCFQGLSIEEERHLLELILLSHVLRLHTVGISSSHDMLKKMHVATSRLQVLHQEGWYITDFIDELKKYSTEEGTRESSRAFPVDKLLQHFYLRPISFCGNFRHIKADLKAIHNNSENRLCFVPGLPVGITFQFILYNIPQGKQIWLRMAVTSSVQYIFIDLCNFRDCNDMRNFTLTFPFYATPSAASFSLKCCICLELPFGGGLHQKSNIGGPKHDIIHISEEVSVYFTGN